MATGEDPSFTFVKEGLSTFNPALPLLAELKARTIDALGKPIYSAAVSIPVATDALVLPIRDAMTQLSLLESGWPRGNGDVIMYDYADATDDWDPYEMEQIEDARYGLYLENTREALLISLYRIDSYYALEYQSYHRRFGQEHMRLQQERLPGSMPLVEAELTTTIGRMVQAEVYPRNELTFIVFAGDGASDSRVRRIAHDAAREYLPESTPEMVPDALDDTTFYASRRSAMLHKAEHLYDELVPFSGMIIYH